jgi:hypothetical protein
MGDDLLRQIEGLRARLEQDPTDEQAHDELTVAFCALGDWRGAWEVLRRWGDIASDPATRARCLLRAAGIAEELLGDLEGAYDGYVAACEADPGSTTAADGAARIRAMRGE